MGRSPFFANYVKPLQKKYIIQELNDLFCYLFTVGNITFYEDNTEVATIDNEKDDDKIYIRIIQSEHMPLLTLERSCSIYRKLDDHFPEKQNIYEVVSAVKYKFQNKNSWGGEPFYYHVLELQNIDDNYYTTFCLKTDGAILNIESLSVRGYVSEVEITPSIKQLHVV